MKDYLGSFQPPNDHYGASVSHHQVSNPTIGIEMKDIDHMDTRDVFYNHP